MWVAATTWVTVFVVRLSRGSHVARELLGKTFAGILVTDRWSAYNWYPVRWRQLCWAHLLRDIHDLRVVYPEDAKLAQWAKAIHKLYAEAKAFVHPETRQRCLAQLRMERKLLAHCRKSLDDPLAVQGKLC